MALTQCCDYCGERLLDGRQATIHRTHQVTVAYHDVCARAQPPDSTLLARYQQRRDLAVTRLTAMLVKIHQLQQDLGLGRPLTPNPLNHSGARALLLSHSYAADFLGWLDAEAYGALVDLGGWVGAHDGSQEGANHAKAAAEADA